MVKISNKYVEYERQHVNTFTGLKSKLLWKDQQAISNGNFFPSFDWDLTNIIPYECTSDTYLQSLQHNIIHQY